MDGGDEWVGMGMKDGVVVKVRRWGGDFSTLKNKQKLNSKTSKFFPQEIHRCDLLTEYNRIFHLEATDHSECETHDLEFAAPRRKMLDFAIECDIGH